MVVYYAKLSAAERKKFQKSHDAAASRVRLASAALEFQDKFVLRRKGITDSLMASELVHDLGVVIKEAQEALKAAKKMEAMLK